MQQTRGTVRDKEWSRAIAQVSKQVLKITFKDGSYGTGFITHTTNAIRGIATAYHIFQDKIGKDHSFTIQSFWKKMTTSDQRLKVLVKPDPEGNDDSALLIVDDDDLPHSHVNLVDASCVLEPGVEVGWLGFPEIEAESLCFFSGRISLAEPDKLRYLIDGNAIGGVSGGPVFYLEQGAPKILGLISGYSPDYMLNDDSSQEFALPGLSVVNDVSLLSRFSMKKGSLPGNQPEVTLVVS